MYDLIGLAVELHRSNMSPRDLSFLLHKTRENSPTPQLDMLTNSSALSFEGEFAEENYVPSTPSPPPLTSARGPPLFFDPSLELCAEPQDELRSELPTLNLDVLGLINDAYNQGYYPVNNNLNEYAALLSRNEFNNDTDRQDAPFEHYPYYSSQISSAERSPKSPYGFGPTTHCQKQTLYNSHAQAEAEEEMQLRHGIFQPTCKQQFNNSYNDRNYSYYSNHSSPSKPQPQPQPQPQQSRPDLSALLLGTEDLDPQQLAALFSKLKKRRRSKSKPYESMLIKFKVKSTSKPQPHHQQQQSQPQQPPPPQQQRK